MTYTIYTTHQKLAVLETLLLAQKQCLLQLRKLKHEKKVIFIAASVENYEHAQLKNCLKSDELKFKN